MIEPPAELGEITSVVGVGLDVVDVARFETALARTPRLASRVFSEEERRVAVEEGGVARLAARFAAKEATLKALGAGIFDLPLVQIEVVGGGDRPPRLELGPVPASAASERGITRWMLSLTHDRGTAAAIVIGVR